MSVPDVLHLPHDNLPPKVKDDVAANNGHRQPHAVGFRRLDKPYKTVLLKQDVSMTSIQEHENHERRIITTHVGGTRQNGVNMGHDAEAAGDDDMTGASTIVQDDRTGLALDSTERHGGSKLQQARTDPGNTTETNKLLKLPGDRLIELAHSSAPSPMLVTLEAKETDNGIKGTAMSPRNVSSVATEPFQTDDTQSRSPLPSPGNALFMRDRPRFADRTFSTPELGRKPASNRSQIPGLDPISDVRSHRIRPAFANLDDKRAAPHKSRHDEAIKSEVPTSIPLPPLSIPTYLQLELSSQRPSPLYIQRSTSSEFPYEPSQVKIDRLLNFLLLPPQLEQVLWFGALACLDAWLYNFTILPLRFLRALSILFGSWARNVWAEIIFLAGFIPIGLRRMWRRRRAAPEFPSEASSPTAELRPSRRASVSSLTAGPQHFTFPPQHDGTAHPHSHPESVRKRTPGLGHRHQRTKSVPSGLVANEKADILKSFLIIMSTMILMNFDASMMYHAIRGQAAIKLYVIYNVLEVFDRLFSALGQDVLEVLLSKETLERKPNGRSKIARPLWLFLVALVYTLVHSTALFYQVITLNVAVNSYSNALLTLLMSNQFVEIKSTVFKRIDKENLFQMTCADVVERFQLGLMLTIIAFRNIVETNGLSPTMADLSSASKSTTLLPFSFTLLPTWVGTVFSPFLIVIGTEVLVDNIKHAYITRFNSVKPNVYARFGDVLAKDYYTHAFADQNLTKRIGLPIIPLSCLAIRAAVQTYQVFLATSSASAFPFSSSSSYSSVAASTALSAEPVSPETSPATAAALQHIDALFRRALGHPPSTGPVFLAAYLPFAVPVSSETLVAWSTTAGVLLLAYLVLLALKLVLGMLLLAYARSRYHSMALREQQGSFAEGKRVGGLGIVEVDDDKRRAIYADDEPGLKRLQERDRSAREREAKGGGKGFDHVTRYAMVAKRIW